MIGNTNSDAKKIALKNGAHNGSVDPGWGVLTPANGYTTTSTVVHYVGGADGEFVLATKDGQTSAQVDGLFYQNEGNDKVGSFQKTFWSSDITSDRWQIFGGSQIPLSYFGVYSVAEAQQAVWILAITDARNSRVQTILMSFPGNCTLFGAMGYSPQDTGVPYLIRWEAQLMSDRIQFRTFASRQTSDGDTNWHEEGGNWYIVGCVRLR